MLRSLGIFLVILAFVLGTMIPASKQVEAHGSLLSSVEHSMPVNCEESDDDTAPPMPCGKAFCAGLALILTPVQATLELTVAKYNPALDQNGAGLSRFPDPDPPRTISVS